MSGISGGIGAFLGKRLLTLEETTEVGVVMDKMVSVAVVEVSMIVVDELVTVVVDEVAVEVDDEDIEVEVVCGGKVVGAAPTAAPNLPI